MRFLFGDIDFSDEKSNGKNYPPDQTTTMEILKDFPLKPALIQNSGNGLHVFWKLSETLKCTSRRSRERAQAIAKCFQRHRRHTQSAFDCPGAGWQYESVQMTRREGAEIAVLL